MFEKVESEDILIEWDYPKPTRVMPLNTRSDIWWRRLNPMRKFPGRRARVARGMDTKNAGWKRNNIVRSLRNHDPYQKWKVETGKEDDGTVSIWVTYEGKMNEDEYLQEQRERQARHEAMKKNMLKNKLARQADVGRSALSASLRPPTLRGG